MMRATAWKALLDCPRYDVVRAAIARAARDCGRDRDSFAWAVIPALYWAAVDCHSGQWSAVYRLACAMDREYSPALTERGIDPETDPIAAEVYNACARAWGAE